MTIKLITYSRAFFPYIFGYKIIVAIRVFLVTRDGKIIKRGFSETSSYAFNGMQYAEIDALGEGLSWIIANVPGFEKEKLEVFFCGASRTTMKKDIEVGVLMNGYRCKEIFDMIEKFDEVRYTSQGKIISEDSAFDLYEFSNKVFELHYGRDNGYVHIVYEYINGKPHFIGEPELWWRNGAPSEAWS